MAAILDSQNLVPLSEAVKKLDTQLEQYLRNEGVRMNRFEDIDELREFLKHYGGNRDEQ